MKPLYKDQLPVLERSLKKTAAFAGRLSEQPENWPQELNSDLYKQLPFLSDYEVNVNLDKADPERGYAFGYADVSNKTERPETEHEEAGMPHVRVPLVVKERMVKPFSVFLDGEKVMPLTEERVREHLFNPSTFDLSTQAPQDPSLVEPLMPPHRSGIGMGGDYKLASADERFLKGLEGKTKKACEVAKSSPINESLPEEPYFVKKFKGTPFEERARDLERQQVKIDLARNRLDQSKEPPAPVPPDNLYEVGEKLRLKKRELELLLQLHQLAPKEKAAFAKVAFKHISKEQWEAIYQSLPVTQLMMEYGSRSHPAVQNKVYEIAAQQYGYHPKPEPASPIKLQELAQKHQEKQMQRAQKATQKAAIGAIKKQGSAETPLLLAIAPTVSAKDREEMFLKIAADPTLRSGLRRSGIFPTLEKFAQTELVSGRDRLQVLSDSIAPTVVTFQKLPGGDFLVKSANNQAFAPNQEAQGQVVPQEEAAEAIGDDAAQSMQPGQTATAVADPVESTEEPAGPQAVVAEQFGEYLAQDLMGNQVMGWVFPTTMAWDGSFSETPVALFTNGSSFAVQDSVAGELIGKNSQLPISPVRGEGVFYEVTRDRVRATAPVTIRGGMSGPDGGPMYSATDFMGNQLQIHVSPELTQPQQISESEFAIPESWKFMALNNQTQLVPDPVQMNKTGAVKRASQKVTLWWNQSFNVEGGCGLSKIAKDFRYDLSPVEAEFVLGLLGVPGADIKEKLSYARKHGSIDLYNLKPITTLAERYGEVEKTAQSLALRIPNLRRDLLKEAAVLEDESTVDKVLALNYINPENLTTFISYVPELEQTSEKLAEMLLSSYLGEDSVPEGAVERAMKNMEEVIQSLRAVSHAEG